MATNATVAARKISRCPRPGAGSLASPRSRARSPRAPATPSAYPPAAPPPSRPRWRCWRRSCVTSRSFETTPFGTRASLRKTGSRAGSPWPGALASAVCRRRCVGWNFRSRPRAACSDAAAVAARMPRAAAPAPRVRRAPPAPWRGLPHLLVRGAEVPAAPAGPAIEGVVPVAAARRRRAGRPGTRRPCGLRLCRPLGRPGARGLGAARLHAEAACGDDQHDDG